MAIERNLRERNVLIFRDEAPEKILDKYSFWSNVLVGAKILSPNVYASSGDVPSREYASLFSPARKAVRERLVNGVFRRVGSSNLPSVRMDLFIGTGKAKEVYRWNRCVEDGVRPILEVQAKFKGFVSKEIKTAHYDLLRERANVDAQLEMEEEMEKDELDMLFGNPDIPFQEELDVGDFYNFIAMAEGEKRSDDLSTIQTRGRGSAAKFKAGEEGDSAGF